MWRLIEIYPQVSEGHLVDATVVRGEADITHPWPITTKPGYDQPGFIFYQLKWSSRDGGEWVLREENRLAERIADMPVLVAVDDFEYDQWRKMTIVAKPAIFRWDPSPVLRELFPEEKSSPAKNTD